MISIAEKIVAGGSCIAHIEGKAVFIPYSLPGETLEIEITERKKDYDFARIVSVIEPSPRRIKPVCPLFGKCGGCSMQMSDSGYQRELRLSILRDVFSRAHVMPTNGIRLESGEPFEYRSRFQFHRAGNEGLGLKEGSGREVIPISDCPVAVPVIRQALKDGSLATDARLAQSGARFHVFGHNGRLWHEFGDSAGIVSISGVPVRFDVRGFFQSNLPMLERLITAIGTNGRPFSGKRLLDFYSGVGTFSVLVGKSFSEIVLVEHNADALSYARANLSTRDGEIRYCAIRDDRWPDNTAATIQYDAAIIDPPRQGIHPKTLSWFAASGIPDIRYVSCDPVTFARDAAKLTAAGYTLTDAILFDFYPQTHHIETLGLFTR